MIEVSFLELPEIDRETRPLEAFLKANRAGLRRLKQCNEDSLNGPNGRGMRTFLTELANAKNYAERLEVVMNDDLAYPEGQYRITAEDGVATVTDVFNDRALFEVTQETNYDAIDAAEFFLIWFHHSEYGHDETLDLSKLKADAREVNGVFYPVIESPENRMPRVTLLDRPHNTFEDAHIAAQLYLIREFFSEEI